MKGQGYISYGYPDRFTWHNAINCNKIPIHLLQLDSIYMKWIISGIIAVVAAMFLYGVFTAKSQLSDNVSVLQVSSTYQSMNPVSRYGYEWVMKNDSIVNYSVIKTNQLLDDLKSQ